MSWLKKFVRVTEESEAPERFFYWSGLSAISAVVKNNVYLDRFYYRLYPNLYVMLIGKSGLRKGVPINLAKRVVKEANNTRVISGRNSIEGIIMDLSKGYSLPSGEVIKDSVGFLVSGEFATFLLENPRALTILTDLYDGHYNEEWKNTLKHSAVETLRNVCLTMLGASNEIHFKDAVPLNAIGGGFLARTMIVMEEDKRGINDLLEPPTEEVSVEGLAEHLKELVKLKGCFKIAEGKAKDVYRKWYLELSTSKIADNTGTIERLHDHVLKISMLLSLARGASLVINNQDIEEAIYVCQLCFGGSKRISMGTGKAPLSGQTAMMLKELVRQPDQEISRTKFLQKYWGEVDAMELDRIVDTLLQAGAIKSEKRGSVLFYKMSKEAYKSYLSFKGEE